MQAIELEITIAVAKKEYDIAFNIAQNEAKRFKPLIRKSDMIAVSYFSYVMMTDTYLQMKEEYSLVSLEEAKTNLKRLIIDVKGFRFKYPRVKQFQIDALQYQINAVEVLLNTEE